MSPELIKGVMNFDPVRSDVWSIGVTLFEVIEANGKKPFDRFRLGSFAAPTQEIVDQLPWNLITDDPLRYLMRRCLMVDAAQRATLAEATAMTFVFTDNGATDVWAGGIAPEREPNVVAARQLAVDICDAKVQANFCTTQDPRALEHVRAAAAAIEAELRSWKTARANPQIQDDVDKAMREVVKARCQSTWTRLAAVCGLASGALAAAAS